MGDCVVMLLGETAVEPAVRSGCPSTITVLLQLAVVEWLLESVTVTEALFIPGELYAFVTWSQ
jgi:hypothetical protein